MCLARGTKHAWLGSDVQNEELYRSQRRLVLGFGKIASASFTWDPDEVERCAEKIVNGWVAKAADKLRWSTKAAKCLGIFCLRWAIRQDILKS